MVSHAVLFLVIAFISLLLFLSGLVVSGWATSVIPGWHTTIYPPFFLVSIGQLAWICILPLLYFLMKRNNIILSGRSVALHVICTCAVFFSANTSTYFMTPEQTKWLTIVPLFLFLAGQLFFLAITTRKLILIKSG